MFCCVSKTYGNSGSYCASEFKSGLHCSPLDFDITCTVTPSVVLNLVKINFFSHNERLENNERHRQMAADFNDSLYLIQLKLNS